MAEEPLTGQPHEETHHYQAKKETQLETQAEHEVQPLETKRYQGHQSRYTGRLERLLQHVEEQFVHLQEEISSLQEHRRQNLLECQVLPTKHSS